MELVTRKDCCTLSRRRRGGVDHALGLSIYFTEPGLFYILLSELDWFGGWCYCTTLSQCHPPKHCDFLEEELVVDDGIKTLDLHLRATCRVRSASYFASIILGLMLLCIPTVSFFIAFILGLILLCIPTVSSFQENILFVFK